MMRAVIMIAICGLTSACASLQAKPETPVKPLEVTPVVQEVQQSFDLADTMARANAAYLGEDYASARNLFEQVLLRDPKHEGAAIGFGNSVLARGEYGLARDIFLTALANNVENSGSPEIESGRILAEILSGNLTGPDAEAQIDTALEIAPSDGRLWNVKGQLLDKQADWVGAMEHYVEAMRFDTTRASAINNMGTSLMLQARYEEAIEKFEQALALRPDRDLYDNNRRHALMFLGQYERALEGLSDERQAILLNDAGQISVSQEDYDSADYFFRQAIRTYPSYFAAAEDNLNALRQKKRG